MLIVKAQSIMVILQQQNLMEQKAQAQLVQQKIKRMIQARKRISSKEGPNTLKRLKSNLEAEQICIAQQQQAPNKPRTSLLRMRPRTSQKSKNQQTNSRTTDSSNKNDIDVKTLINDAFLSGYELAKYLSKKGLSPEESKQKLLENNLFYTIVISKLSRVQEEEYQHVTQKQIISKLQKISIMEKQEVNCRLIQNKISSLIEEKLKSLSRG